MRDILFAGLFGVLFNRCNGYHQNYLCTSLKKGEVYAFSLFVIMSVFVWAIFAAACAESAKISRLIYLRCRNISSTEYGL